MDKTILHRYRALLLFVAALALPFSSAFAKDKVEKPSKAAKTAIKKFFKQKSYAVNCHVRGGVSSNKQHDLSEVIVDKSYDGESIKKIVKVAAPQAYRRGKKGAIFDEQKGLFMSILGNSAGTEMNRLFQLPESVLTNAYKYAKTAKWIVPPTNGEADSDDNGSERKGPVTQAGDSEETAVDDVASVEIKNPVLRITLPASVSIKEFIKIENSDCMGGG